MRQAERRYRTVQMSIDGVLLDSVELQAHAWKAVLFEHRYFATLREITDQIGDKPSRIVEALTGCRCGTPESHRLISHWQGLYPYACTQDLQPLPHIRTLVQRMRDDDLHIQVDDTYDSEQRQMLIKIAGIDDLLCHQDCLIHPDRAAAIQIGATPSDVMNAQRAGVAVIALHSGRASSHQLAGALAVYDDPMDLLENYATSPLALEFNRFTH